MPRFPALLALLSLAACGSTANSRTSDAPVATRPLRVRFVDWRSGQDLVLVDQSHTDRSKLYSSRKPLSEAGTKVTTDEILEETLRFFREQGFFDRARGGVAGGAGGAVQSLEVETPDGIVHLDVGPRAPAADARILRQCSRSFVELYNSIYQLQSVDRVPDWEPQKKSSSGRSGQGRVP